MSNNSNFFLGLPQEFLSICLVYPPKVKDVSSNKYFSNFVKILTITQEEIEDEQMKNKQEIKPLTPLEFLLSNCFYSKEFEIQAKLAFEFFTHEQVQFLYEEKAIVLGTEKENATLKTLRALDSQNYFQFQNLIRMSVGEKEIEAPKENENPRIRAMKAKARYRDRIKAKQAAKSGLNFTTILSSICCMGMGLNPLNIGELSYAAVPILMGMYQGKERYDLDIKSLLAGADSKKIHPKYWIKNLED